MRLILRCKLDLDALLESARRVPQVLEEKPKLEIDGGTVQFDTPDDVLMWLKIALQAEKKQ